MSKVDKTNKLPCCGKPLSCVFSTKSNLCDKRREYELKLIAVRTKAHDRHRRRIR